MTSRAVIVTRKYEGFEYLWSTLLRGSTPSTLALASLSDTQLVRAQDMIVELLFDGALPQQSVALQAKGLLVKGVAS